MQKRKFKRFGAVFLIVAMIVTMFSTVSASADEGGAAGGESSTTSAIYVNPGWYLRSPHRISYYDQTGIEHSGIAPALFSLKLLGASDSEAFGVYCCDVITDAKNDTTYVRTNLEDALNEDGASGLGYTAYYTKENAARLRYILKYGFHAGYSDAELSALASKAGITKEDGDLTRGEALSATQCAIWSLANPNNLKDIYTGTTKPADLTKILSDELDGEINSIPDGVYNMRGNRIKKVYDYLVESSKAGYENPSVIVQFTDENTVLTVKKLTAEGAVYDVSASFKLKGTFTDSGDLKLTASLGEQSQTWQLLSGEGNKLTADKDGMYTITFENVPAASLTGQPEIQLVLDGSQTIKTGFYFYEPINPETGKVQRSYAQSFVGTGEGSTPIHRETTIGFQLGTKTVKVKKYDGSAQMPEGAENPPLEGVEFALYVKYGDLTEPVLYPGLANKTTDKNGEITWENLAEEKNTDGTDMITYYVREVSAPAGYEKNNDMIQVGQTQEPTAVTNCHDLGGLTISKTTRNVTGEANADRHYDFLLELDYGKAFLASNNHEWTSAEMLEKQYAALSAEYAYGNTTGCEAAEGTHPASVTLKKNTETGKMTAAISLAAGESITLTGIPAGAEYTVTELDADGNPMGDKELHDFSGELIAADDGSRTGVIKADENAADPAAEEFVNTGYEEAEVDVDAQFSILKNLDGRPSVRAFRFTLTDVTGGGNQVLQTVNNETEGNNIGRVDFAPVSFRAAGNYTFEIREVLESGYICDDAVYKIEVTVVQNDEEHYLKVTDVKYYGKDGQELQTGDSMVFSNRTVYGSYTSVGVKKVWELNGKAEMPESVTVNLLKNGKVDQTVVLSADNSWSHTWNLLDDSYTWTVSEADVPEGFTSVITKDGLTFTITNTYVEEETPDEGNGGGDTGSIDSGDHDVPNGSMDGEDTEAGDSDVPTGDMDGFDSTPKTGDETPVALLIVLLALSACGFGALTLNRRKHQ